MRVCGRVCAIAETTSEGSVRCLGGFLSVFLFRFLPLRFVVVFFFFFSSSSSSVVRKNRSVRACLALPCRAWSPCGCSRSSRRRSLGGVPYSYMAGGKEPLFLFLSLSLSFICRSPPPPPPLLLLQGARVLLPCSALLRCLYSPFIKEPNNAIWGGARGGARWLFSSSVVFVPSNILW